MTNGSDDLRARRPDPGSVAGVSGRVRCRPARPGVCLAAAAHLDGLELRRRRHLAVGGPVQRARRWQHQLHRVELGHRHERLLQQDGRLRRDRHLVRHATGELQHEPGALSVPVHARRRRRAGLRVQPARVRTVSRSTNLVLNASDPARDLHRRHQQLGQPRHRRAESGTSGCPNQPITAYYRSDPSGENYLLS